MIIKLDANVWEKLAEFFGKRDIRSGTVIIEKHLIGDHHLHWACDLGGKKLLDRGKLLGRVELTNILPTSMLSIRKEQVKAAGVESKEFLNRTFLTVLGRRVDAITVAKMRIVEIERYWCTKCQSVNLDFLKKDISNDQLPFSCFDCENEFYTPDKDEGSPRVKNAKLEERYCREKIKRIPVDQQAVLAIVGERWFEI